MAMAKAHRDIVMGVEPKGEKNSKKNIEKKIKQIDTFSFNISFSKI